jgi:uncharacterized cupredoxin-like copper-binding protein
MVVCARLGVRLWAVGVVAAAVLFVSACGGGARVGGVRRVVNVSDRDFRIVVSPPVVPAGVVVLRAWNRGPDAHELIVVRSPAGRLPLRSDGLTVDEEVLEHSTIGALEPGRPGALRELRVRLSVGKYVLFCNMSGHYMGGMSAVLIVR